MEAGIGYTKTTEKGETIISISIDDVALELYPEFKNLRFILKFIKQEDRSDNPNAPHWRLIAFKPQEKGQRSTQKVEEANNAIIAEGTAQTQSSIVTTQNTTIQQSQGTLPVHDGFVTY